MDLLKEIQESLGYDGPGFKSMQVFTSDGTWTKPSGINTVKVIVTGGSGEVVVVLLILMTWAMVEVLVVLLLKLLMSLRYQV